MNLQGSNLVRLGWYDDFVAFHAKRTSRFLHQVRFQCGLNGNRKLQMDISRFSSPFIETNDVILAVLGLFKCSHDNIVLSNTQEGMRIRKDSGVLVRLMHQKWMVQVVALANAQCLPPSSC